MNKTKIANNYPRRIIDSPCARMAFAAAAVFFARNRIGRKGFIANTLPAFQPAVYVLIALPAYRQLLGSYSLMPFISHTPGRCSCRLAPRPLQKRCPFWPRLRLDHPEFGCFGFCLQMLSQLLFELDHYSLETDSLR